MTTPNRSKPTFAHRYVVDFTGERTGGIVTFCAVWEGPLVHVGCAWKAPGDEWNRKRGVAIAEGRALRGQSGVTIQGDFASMEDLVNEVWTAEGLIEKPRWVYDDDGLEVVVRCKDADHCKATATGRAVA